MKLPMDRVERRRAVRMKPIPECPASALLLDTDPPAPLAISDVGAGGIAFETAPDQQKLQPDQRLSLRLKLAHYGEHTVTVIVRYVNDDGITGAQFVDLDATTMRIIWHYVAELLERGAPS